MNGKSVRIGIVAVFLLVVAALALIAANPHGCPPGQDGQCKLVEHVVTLKQKCLPLHAVAHPWRVIPDPNGICSTLDPDPATPTAKPPVDPTAEPSPTSKPGQPPVGEPTAVPPTVVPPTASPTSTPTLTVPTTEPTDPVTQISPTCTPTPVLPQPDLGDCDICEQLRRQADALERIAAAQETQAAKP